MAALVAGLAILAVGLAWWAHATLQPRLGIGPGELALLLGLAVMGVLLRERGLGPQWGVSVATVILAAAIPVAGPVGAAATMGLAYLVDVGHQTLRTRLFNTSMSALMGAVGGVAYLLFGGELIQDAPESPMGLLLRIGAPLGVAYAVMTIVNALCIGAMSAAVRGTKVLRVAQSVLRSLGLGYFSHVVIGFLFVVLWGPVGLGPTAAVFVLGPLLVAHWTIGREAMARREHQETVTTFVAALEQSDPASVGHSARVAGLAEALGSQMDSRGLEVEELRYAALLHDIGILVVRPEMPTDSEMDEIAYLSVLSAHPQAGVNLLSGLDFLEGALPAIAHHHERWDGRGYPAGLSGKEIPIAARIIAVADTFDALTAQPRDDALSPEAAADVISARAGTHLDPAVVEALRALIARPGSAWGVRVQIPPVATDAERRHPNHDHPMVGDAYADWQPESSTHSA